MNSASLEISTRKPWILEQFLIYTGFRDFSLADNFCLTLIGLKWVWKSIQFSVPAITPNIFSKTEPYERQNIKSTDSA